MKWVSKRRLKRKVSRTRFWPPYWRPGDILAIVMAIGLVSAGIAGLIFYDRTARPTHNFGPEWDCNQSLIGEPICIKKPNRSGAAE